ncbi:MAG: hypothetical protein HC906_07865 [Bacteroidales bacterium]|nr:hypothetical protein [Bacteroidales bacterium]
MGINLLTGAKIYKQKIMNGFTISANYRFNRSLGASLSWSYLHNSINNFGAAVVVGRSPVQFYMASDNVPGLIFPTSTKNINLCFGLNILFGCNLRNSNLEDCGCEWLRNAEERSERKETRLKGKKLNESNYLFLISFGNKLKDFY